VFLGDDTWYGAPDNGTACYGQVEIYRLHDLPATCAAVITVHGTVHPHRAAAVPEEVGPVRWTGRQAVVTLPEHIDRSNADEVRDELLRIINRGAVVLIADMTATLSCDYSGADAPVRAYGRAVANGTQLRLVVTAEVVRRALCLIGP
jgi:anti-anti-sigma regulatory factor